MLKSIRATVLLSTFILFTACTTTPNQSGSSPSPNSSSTPDPNSSSTPNPSVSPSSSTGGSSGGLINATYDSSVKETNCALERNLAADLGNMFSINFENKTNIKLKVYSITSSRTRDFKQDILPSEKYRRQNGITNQPWVITDENENCLKIFTGVVSGESFITLN